ncbi:DUF4062 domain-containing protein [Rhizobium leguminosarum]|uniref:DUF4062 domain-containing protein n=1 Tax=Rhizobium leguminosarum TaxID=384 RepID=UPI003F99F29D
MSFVATTYRVLIASPSDLAEERVAATAAINEWNAEHAGNEGVVLLPVKWETHARPSSNVRPQAAINEQLVHSADILVGMFWTKIGTSTGVAESGTVEEINEIVAADKPALLYFSKRPIDPGLIDMNQHRRLKKFKESTYRNSLVGSFSSLKELKDALSRDLTSQVRSMRTKPPRRRTKLDQAQQLTEIIGLQKKLQISPEEFESYRNLLLGNARTKSQTTDPAPADALGPNGYKIEYTAEGDKVELIPDDENPGEFWPMILRRGDRSILAAEQEFFDRIWYDRKRVFIDRIKDGEETVGPEIEKGMRQAMRAVEKRYGGKKALRSYYSNDFEWGMLNGKLSALRWVTGDDWDNLDT